MTFTKRLTLLLSAMAVAAAAAAYTISGVVTDLTGEPLPAASVRLLSQRDSTLVNGTVSDSDGHFSLPDLRRGRYLVEVSYVGYNAKT
ncbi:MAG: carboxypeptidase-like regulatory domain-containing protein, partial [Muribaculaceae bacterium]|nr:carboxypeptidase-like regulatory domain-containing protein [Muribaculaceae bacterium]